MSPEDFLCDFCGRSWPVAQPFVEGHQGGCICGRCLTAALRALAQGGAEARGAGPCTLCLEHRDEPAWSVPAPAHSPADRTVARLCRRCAGQSARTLERDADAEWTRPVTGA